MRSFPPKTDEDESYSKKPTFTLYSLVWAWASQCLYRPFPWANNTSVIISDSGINSTTDVSLRQAGTPYLKRSVGALTFYLVGDTSLPLGEFNGQFHNEDDLFSKIDSEDNNSISLSEKAEKQMPSEGGLDDPDQEELAEEQHLRLVRRYKFALTEMRMTAQLLISMLESNVFENLVPPDVQSLYRHEFRKLVNQINCEYLQSRESEVKKFDPPDYFMLDMLFCRVSFALREACLDFARHMKENKSANKGVSYQETFSTLNSAILDSVVCATLISYLRSNADLLQARFTKATGWMDELNSNPLYDIFEKDLLAGEKEAQGLLTGERKGAPDGWIEAEVEMTSVYNVPERVDLAELMGIYETLRQHQMVVVTRLLENRDSSIPLSKNQVEQVSLMLRILGAQACGIPIASLPPEFSAASMQQIAGLGSLSALFTGPTVAGRSAPVTDQDEAEDMGITIEDDEVDFAALMKQSDEHTKALQKDAENRKMKEDLANEKLRLDKEREDIEKQRTQLEKEKKEGSGGSSASGSASSASGSNDSNASGSADSAA